MSRVRLTTFLTSLLPLFILAHFSHHVVTAITTPVLPLIRDTFALSYARAGIMVSAYTLAYGVGHLVVGGLMGRVSPRLLITIGISGAAVFGVFIGLSKSFATLVAFQFMLGVAGSGYHPAAATLISAAVEPENRGSALGFHIIGGSASFFLTPLLVGLIVGSWGWRGSFIALAIPTFVLGLLLFVLLGRMIPGARSNTDEKERSVSDVAPASWPVVVAVMALATIGGAIVQSTIAFIPLVSVDVHGIPVRTAARLMALVFAAGLWVSPLAGWLSDRIGRLPMLIGVSLIAVPTVGLLAVVPYGLAYWSLLLLVGVYTFVRMPISESFILGHVEPRFRSATLGIYFFVSSAGVAVFTPLMGRIADGWGFGRAFAVLAAALLLVTLVCTAVIAFGYRKGVRKPA